MKSAKALAQTIFLSENLKFLRRLHSHTQQDLAEALQLKRHSIEKWENLGFRPDNDTIVKLAKFFTVTCHDFCFTDLSKKASHQKVA